MPELPEVETVRRGLDRQVAGRTVAAVDVLHPRAVRRHAAGADDLAARLAGQPIRWASRRGKYLWLPLGSGEALVAHLGMSGQFRMAAAADPPERHLRVRIAFADGGPDLLFLDQRTFGGLAVEPLVPVPGGQVPASVAHIAADPLEPGYDRGAVAAALRRRRTGLKRALLDQTLLSGVGNIYADEALWRARRHHATPTDRLGRGDALSVLGHVHDVLVEALEAGGTSFDALYVNVNGESGYFSRSLNAYGRAGRPCPRCQAPIRREAFMNRSSYRCPRCQRTPRSPHW